MTGAGAAPRRTGASRLVLTYAILKRELKAYFLSPITYILGALFLCVQGYSFFLVCQALTNQRASTAAVMQYFFGGTFVYWVFLMFIVSVLTMRLIAEERQRGTIEPLLTAPVREGAVVLGKYLAAVLCYCALWAPTLAYTLLLRRYASFAEGAAGHLDTGPIAGAYLGTLLCGASALALGLLCSTLTRSQVLAAALSFSILTLLLLAGLLADLYLRSPTARAILLYVNQFRHLDELARGIIDSRRLLYHLSLAAAALLVAARALATRPGEARRGAQTVVEALLCLGLLFAVNALGARHFVRADWTAARQFTLSPRLLDLLDELGRARQQVQLVGLGLEQSAAEDPGGVADTTRELLQRASRAARGALPLELLDIDRDRERVRLLSERYKLDREELRRGAVVVERGGRQRVLTRDDLAEFEAGAGSEPPRLLRYLGESALASAVLTVMVEKPPTLCFTTGHGEAALDDLSGEGLSDLSQALQRDGQQTRALPELTSAGLLGCDGAVAAGPERPFTPAEAAELGRYLEQGGRLLLLIGPLLDSAVTQFQDSGLTTLLRERGLRLEPAVVIDPQRRLGESPAFVVDEGYANHPVTERLQGKRTLWSLARPLRALPAVPLQSGALWSATEVVRTGERGFGETDLTSLREGRPVAGADDLPGPVAVAAAAEVKEGSAAQREARLFVIGASRFAHNDTMALYNKDLVLSALSWLLAQTRQVRIEPKQPEQLRLVLEQEQLTRLFLVTVVGMPLMALLLGIGVFWVRRG